jgi:hypothetical protein
MLTSGTIILLPRAFEAKMLINKSVRPADYLFLYIDS